MNNSNISQEELDKASNIISGIQNYYSQRIVGQKRLEMSLLVSLLANGHILIESVPGLAKTTAAKVLTNAVNGRFSRIQCTPDLLPSDIIGIQTFNYQKSSFETRLGPVYANFVLLDEINRSNAKTQSAMLEAMQERQVSIGGKKYAMPNVFIVIATQNPIEQEGTYLLSEAQQDRFLIKEVLNYPSPEEEYEVLNRIENNVFANSNPIFNLEEVEFLQNLTQRVYIDDAIKKYIVSIISATRYSKKYIKPELAKYIVNGSSTRGSIAFMEATKALALINKRSFVTPDDVKMLKYEILRHRVELSFEAIADEVTVEQIIDEIVNSIKAP